MKIKELDLIEKQDIRERVIDRTEVLDKVGDLLLLPNTEYATTEQVANYYKVDVGTIEVLVNRNRDELESDGMAIFKKSKIERSLQDVSNVKVARHQGYMEIIDNDMTIRIANRGARLFPKRAILRVGMLLRDSKVAKEVRTRLLDIIHDVEQGKTNIIEGITEEINEEKRLMLERVQAEMDGDYAKVCEINAQLFAIKNKRIDELETENKLIKTHSLTITESRAVINRIVRSIAMKEYNSIFGRAYSELYTKANYILGINIKARNKKKGESYLNTLTEKETFEVEKIVRAWAVEVGLDLEKLLKIA